MPKETVLKSFLDSQLRIREMRLLTGYPDIASPEGLSFCRGQRDKTLMEDKISDVGKLSVKLLLLEKCLVYGPEKALTGITFDNKQWADFTGEIPAGAENYIREANIYARRFEHEKAINTIEKLIHKSIDCAPPFLLGELYRLVGHFFRIKATGDPAENILKALSYYNRSEKIFSRHTYPREWALLQTHRANAYHIRPDGDRAENMEKAIELNETALDVLDPNLFPAESAMISVNLASEYTLRIRGDDAENIERAIKLHRKALATYTELSFPREWAVSRSMLAAAYHIRMEGDREENEEIAISLYSSVLDSGKRWLPKPDRARLMNNLAISYMKHPGGDRTGNMKKASLLFRESLKFFTKEAFPLQWAQTCVNLATVCMTKQCEGLDSSNSIEESIHLLEKSLKILTLEKYPWDWARTKFSMGNAYLRLGKDDFPEKAADNYRAAMKVWKPETSPYNSMLAAINLCEVEALRKNWVGVLEAATIAREADRTLMMNAVTLSNRTDKIEKSARLYYLASFAHLHLDNHEMAMEWLEQGKTRELGESVSRDRAIFNHRLAVEDAAEYKRFLALMKTTEAEQRKPLKERRPLEKIVAEARTIKTRFEEVIRKIKSYEPEFLSGIDFSREKKRRLLLKPDTAYILFNVTMAGTATILLYGQNEKYEYHSFFVNDFNLTSLNNLSARWKRQIEDIESGIAATREGRKAWSRRLNEICRELYDHLFRDVHKWLKMNPDINHLVFIPHLALHSMPLHLMKYNNDNVPRFLIEDFDISSAPSLTLLSKLSDKVTVKTKQTITENDTLELLAVAGPSGDLNWSAGEVTEIAKLFRNSSLVFSGKYATPGALKREASRARILHLCCHGTFDHEDPWNSSLVLFPEETGRKSSHESGHISLREIFSGISITETDLVVLSACETGIVRMDNKCDEFVGLPGGFLRAGARCVVASLWSVDDRATASIMKKFYRGMTIDGLGPAESLRKAQLDLKSERRWKNPFFWGAFRTLGFCHNTAETEMREKEYHEK